MTRRLLVAGVGNIFRSDDGVATAVIALLTSDGRTGWPDWVGVRDYGISSLHLAYDLVAGETDLILVDAMRRDGPAGTVYVVEPGPTAATTGTVYAHDLAPEAVLSLVPALGGRLGHVTIVGCEPATTADGMGLSPIVAAQVPTAARAVHELVDAAVARAGSQLQPSHPAGDDG
jgi:hydrogenase maturation protease